LGYSEFQDLQNLDNNNGTERWLRYVGPDGLRQDAAHRYLHPLLQSGNYPNLHVLVEHKTKRVLFDDKLNATGVELQSSSRDKHTSFGSLEIKARRLVVLSSGANGTPLILERSGVGDSQVLKRAGVRQLVDLPGVGADYQDHHLSLWAYRTNLTPFETLNGFGKGTFDIKNPSKEVKALMGWNSMDASGKFRPTEEEVSALGPEFKAAWDKDFKNASDRPLMIIALYNAFLGKKGGIAGNFGDFSTLPDDAEYVSCANWTAYPYSRGSIHITGPEATDLPDFNVGYLTDDGDVDMKKHIWAYKISREMFRRMAIYRGELASMHPRFPEGSKAAVQEKADGPIPLDTPRVQYSAEDDKAIEQATREVVGTTWHSLGTCKMKPRDKNGVVDPALNVYGVKRLKLADLSVPPENVGANTNNTALMIGEKAADIIIRELGLGSKRKDSASILV
jgi:alcohol oxidase